MYKRTKKILAGALAATMFALQVPVTALAATDNDAATAAGHAIEYLIGNQAMNGDIPPVAEWAALALAAGGRNPATVQQNGGASALHYLLNTPLDPAGYNPTNALASRILAIAGAGQDTAAYNQTLEAMYYDYDNGQFGDPNSLNEDVFSILAILASDDIARYPLAQSSLSFLIDNQEDDGGFGYSTFACDWQDCKDSDTDMTAATIIAMKAAETAGLVEDGFADEFTAAQHEALQYLLEQQGDDGSFGFSSGPSTSWALMALNALGDSVQEEAAAARSWLLTQQNDDGSFSLYNPEYDFTYDYTADAVLALLGTNWLLDPTPLEIPTPSKPTPVITTTPSPAAPQPTTNFQTASVDNAQVLAVETTAGEPPETTTTEEESAPQDETEPVAETGSSVVKYLVYAAIALALIGLGWHLLLPKKAS